MGDEETEEKELVSVPVYNLGAVAAWHQLSRQELYKRVIEVFRTLFEEMRENLTAAIAAREIYEYYMKYEETALKTVLQDIEQALWVYRDKDHGMGNNVSLKEWVKPLLSKDAGAHPQYRKLGEYFNLTEEEMRRIYSRDSMLSRLVAFVKRTVVRSRIELMRGKYNCTAAECDDDELVYRQLANQSVVKIPLIALPTLEPITSYKDLQRKCIVPPELPYFKEHYNLTVEEKKVNIPYDLLSAILDFTSPQLQKSILNPVNGERFVEQIESRVPLSKLEYSYLIGNKTMSFYTFLHKYTQFLVNAFGNLEPLGGTQQDSAFADLFLTASNNFISHLTENIERAVYARLLYNELAISDKKCAEVFETSGLGSGKVWKICNDASYNFDRVDNCELWLACEHSDCFSLKAKFDLNHSEIIAIFNPFEYGTLGYYLDRVKRLAASAYQCAAFTCSLDELIALQWGSSGVTGNVSSVYNNSSITVDAISLHDWVPEGKAVGVEYYTFGCQRYMNESIDAILLKKEVSTRLLKEVLSDRTEVVRLLVRLRNWTKEKLREEYGLKTPYILHNYMRTIVEEYLFDGITRNVTLRELAWGFFDQSSKKIVLFTVMFK